MYKKLRMLRKMNDLTLKQLSQMCGIHYSYLWQIEHEKVREIKNPIKRINLDKAMERLEKEGKKAFDNDKVCVNN